jgi:hypothetical protein
MSGAARGRSGVRPIAAPTSALPPRLPLRLRHPGRSRSEAEAQTRDPCLGRCREAGRRRKATPSGTLSCIISFVSDGEAWIPDTSSFAPLGRRSGMTNVGGGARKKRRQTDRRSGIRIATSTPPSPSSSRAKPERSGGADPGSMPRPMSKGGRRRKAAAVPAKLPRHRACLCDGEAWIPDTSSFAPLGRRSGMTKVGGCRPPAPRPQRPSRYG